MKQTVQMADIARMAGVSKTTVSLALKGHPRISDATREKIVRIASEHEYEPNPVAQAMNLKRHRHEESRILGTMAMLLSCSHARVRYPHPSVAMWNEQLRAGCERMGYRMDRFVVGSSRKEQKALSRILLARGIQGVFIYGDNSEVRNWALDWDRFAAASFSGASEEHFIHNVAGSSSRDLFEAVLRLRKRGYSRLGFFFSERNYCNWRIGLHAALNLSKRRNNQALCVCADSLSKAEVQAEFTRWVEAYAPDVIVSAYAEVPETYIPAIGLRMPEDVGYFCMDVWPHTQHLSGVIQRRSVAYKTAVELICGMIQRNEFGPPEYPVNLEIPAAWHEGTTIRLVDSP